MRDEGAGWFGVLQQVRLPDYRPGGGDVPQVPVAIPTPAAPVQTVKKERLIDQKIQSVDPLIERSSVIIPRDPQDAIPPEPAAVQETQPAAIPAAAQPQKRFIPRLSSPQRIIPPHSSGLYPSQNPGAERTWFLSLVSLLSSL